MIPTQRAMSVCAEGRSEPAEIAECIQQAQQTFGFWGWQTLSTLIGPVGTVLQSMLGIMSSAFLFYRLQVAPPPEDTLPEPGL